MEGLRCYDMIDNNFSMILAIRWCKRLFESHREQINLFRKQEASASCFYFNKYPLNVKTNSFQLTEMIEFK